MRSNLRRQKTLDTLIHNVSIIIQTVIFRITAVQVKMNMKPFCIILSFTMQTGVFGSTAMSIMVTAKLQAAHVQLHRDTVKNKQNKMNTVID